MSAPFGFGLTAADRALIEQAERHTLTDWQRGFLQSVRAARRPLLV